VNFKEIRRENVGLIQLVLNGVQWWDLVNGVERNLNIHRRVIPPPVINFLTS